MDKHDNKIKGLLIHFGAKRIIGTAALVTLAGTLAFSAGTSTFIPRQTIEDEHDHNHDHDLEDDNNQKDQYGLTNEDYENMMKSIFEFNQRFYDLRKRIDNGEIQLEDEEKLPGQDILEALQNGTIPEGNKTKNDKVYIEDIMARLDQIDNSQTPEVTPDVIIPWYPSPSTPIQHEHSWSDWTALNEILEIRYCSCGARETRAHDFRWTYLPNLNIDKGVCQQCGYIKTRPHQNEHTTHTYGPWEYLNENNEVRRCSCGAEETRAHSWSAWAIDPQDSTKEYRICSTCHHRQTRDKVHDVHEFGDWGYLDDNNEVRRCSCGAEETRSHSWGGWIYNSTTGQEDSTCSTCGYTRHRAHNHTYGDWGYLNDELEARTCSSCSTQETRGHSWGGWTYNSTTGQEDSTCSTCGHTRHRAHTHTSDGNYVWNQSTKVYEAHCTVCGQVCDTQAHTHTPGNWTYVNDTQHARSCTICGDVIEYANHSWGPWVVNGNVEESTCTVCGHTRTQEHIAHVHTISTVRRDTHAIDGSTCETTIVTECTDPNCPDANHMHEENTTTQAHHFVRGAGRDIGGIMEYPTYCEYCGYEGPLEYEVITTGLHRINPRTILSAKIEELWYNDINFEEKEKGKTKVYHKV